MSSRLYLHPYYVFFFLYLEPISALTGSIAALFPASYLNLLDPSKPSVVTIPDDVTATVVTQIANLYLFFALTEALVLRSGRHHLPTWKALVIPMLIADFGHLLACWRFGSAQYWSVTEWGSMEMGGIGFVYAGAVTRILFLSGFGVRIDEDINKKKI